MMRYIESPQHGELKVSDRDSVQAILNKVLTIEVEALKETNNMLEPAIFIMANKCSTVHSAMTVQYLQATGAPKDHVGFIISRTGENRMLLDIAHLLKLRGISIILITAARDSSIAALADVIFPVASNKKMEELGNRVFLLGAKFVMDVLFAVLMTHVDYNNAKQKEQWLSKKFYY